MSMQGFSVLRYSVCRSTRHSGGLSAGIHRKELDAGLKTAGMTCDEMDSLVVCICTRDSPANNLELEQLNCSSSM